MTTNTVICHRLPADVPFGGLGTARDRTTGTQVLRELGLMAGNGGHAVFYFGVGHVESLTGP